MKTDVSFIILSHNDADIVIGAVKSIKKLKTKYRYDIYVVDNGSEAGTTDKIKRELKNIKIIKLNKNTGTAAYDVAAKKSNSKYIFFTGCDIEVKEDMLDKLVDFLEKNKDTVQAAPKYIDFHNRKKIDLAGTWLSRSFYSGTFKDNTLGNKPVEIPYIGTGLIRNDFVKKLGYIFDNDYFFYGEDVDLGLRIRLLGYKVYYIPDAIVYHKGSISRKLFKSYFLTLLMERNLLRTFFTSLYVKNLILFLAYVLAIRLFAVIKDFLRLRFLDGLARLYAVLWVLFHFAIIIRKRNIVQGMRKVADNELLNFFTEKYLFRF